MKGDDVAGVARHDIETAQASDHGRPPVPVIGADWDVPVTRLWTAFVVGWLLVFGVTGNLLVRERLPPSRLAAVLLGLTLLAGLYLWVAMRSAIGPADLSPGGPGRAAVRQRLLLLAAMTLLVVGLVVLVPHGEVWWLVMHVIVAAGLVLPPSLAVGVSSALIASTIACAWLVGDAFDAMLLILVAFGAGAIAIRQLTLSVFHLRAAREELARAAVDQERLRFARDLHDLLGHSLSLITLKSELAGRLLPASPARAAIEVGDVERAARDALRQVRAAVTGYRQPVLHRELDTARELLAAAGIASAIDHSAGPLSPALDGLLAWAVREGVTNVIRHSRARRCDIRLSRLGERTRLTITDDGRGTLDGHRSDGSGLAGLAERTTAFGAELEAGPQPGGGFRLMVTVPTSGAVAEGAP
jgi:two-component system sensor histidine kinase DesK